MNTEIADQLKYETRRIILFGASGTIGRATAQRLLANGFETICVVRRTAKNNRIITVLENAGAIIREADPSDIDALRQSAFCGEKFDAIISCIASRTGATRDAWAVDHDMNANILKGANEAGVDHFILLSAICVQKPKLAFQKAKRAFEKKLMVSGLTYSIVRPTAFFKSLSGQAERIRKGKSFLVFGDGQLTACKPISDGDLATFIVSCLDDPAKRNAILPIGGPGPALTPRDQGTLLFEAFGRPAKFTSAPVQLLDLIIAAFGVGGALSTKLKEKAELARIGRYYATESMLVYDEELGAYNADRTPEFGAETLRDYYQKIVRGEIADDRGEHAVF